MTVRRTANNVHPSSDFPLIGRMDAQPANANGDAHQRQDDEDVRPPRTEICEVSQGAHAFGRSEHTGEASQRQEHDDLNRKGNAIRQQHYAIHGTISMLQALANAGLPHA